jgi:hypothetical protein
VRAELPVRPLNGIIYIYQTFRWVVSVASAQVLTQN